MHDLSAMSVTALTRDDIDNLLKQADPIGDVVTAASSSRMALQHASQLRYAAGEIRAGRILGHCHVRQGELTEAVSVLDAALTRLLDDPDDIEKARVLRCLASAWEQGGQLADSMRAVLESLTLLEGRGESEEEANARRLYGILLFEVGDTSGALEQLATCQVLLGDDAETAPRALLQISLGVVHGRLGNPSLAASHFTKALGILASSCNEELHIYTRINLCACYKEAGEYGAAIVEAERVLAGADRLNREKPRIYALLNLGDIARRQGNRQEAIALLRDALDRSVLAGLRRTEVEMRTEMARALIDDGRRHDALEELETALGIADDLGLTRSAHGIHQLLSDVYEEDGNTGAAIHHLREFHRLYEVTWSAKATQRYTVLEVRTALEQSNREAAALKSYNDVLAATNEENERLLRQLETQAAALEQLSREDPLTGISNRRDLDERLHAEIARAERFGHPLVLALLDVDHFKSVNDSYSHAAGDRVLRSIAQYLRSNTRAIDIVARYGGEEFALVFVETPLDAGSRLCEKLREGVAAMDWSALAQGRTITVSIGVAAWNEFRSATELIAGADARLYQAKRAGRNRVVFD
jgi:diguanylate cyclase (GGDEF)-like protein